jgi:hypothetical protein
MEDMMEFVLVGVVDNAKASDEKYFLEEIQIFDEYRLHQLLVFPYTG